MNGLASFVAKYFILLSILATLYQLWTLDKAKRKQFVLILLVGGILSLAAAKLAAHLYTDPRPFIKDGVAPLISSSAGNGFPSDHALLASFLGFATLIYSRRLGLALLAVALLVGWARVYAGVHHFVDILGSFVITAAAVLVARALVNKYSPEPKAYHKTHSEEK